MRALLLTRLAPLAANPAPLLSAEIASPAPRAGEVSIEISTCGVCRTELDEIEGRTPPPRLPIVPGHQIVGRVVERGEGARLYELGARVGVGWIHSSSGGDAENLSPRFRATGRDENGGYAERIAVPEQYAYPIPEKLTDLEAAPLLCAGAVGYRALRLAALDDGDPLGLMGFGASAHLVLPLARHLYPRSPVYVFARGAQDRELALELGAHWAGEVSARPPELARSIIDTTPAWTPLLAALQHLRPGGRLVVNAIRKDDADRAVLQSLSYETHLWMERELKTVANVTAADIRELLRIAAEIPLRPRVTAYPLHEANRALGDLQRGSGPGAKVLVVHERT